MRAFRIAYDGTAFHGFQRQPDVRTVEDALLTSCSSLGVDALDAGYAAAGRTDAGVSAVAQTVAFTCPSWLSPSALNGSLPETIRAWAFADVPETFHPRYDAIERDYVYYLPFHRIDVSAARAACARLEGTHDFRNLSASSTDTKRTVTHVDLASGQRVGALTVRAPAFLHQQVRRMARLVYEVGVGSRSLADVESLLSGVSQDGPDGVQPAPPEPLLLSDVIYPDIAFTLDDRACSFAQEYFCEHADVVSGYAGVLAGISSRLTRESDDQYR